MTAPAWAKAPEFPAGQYGQLVRQGWQIFTNTPKYARQFTGNELSCSSCHLNAGTQANAAPLWGAAPMYPRYQDKFKRVVTLQERMQQCFEFSERGWQPPLDSKEILALSAYAHWTAKGRSIGELPKGAGFPVLPSTGKDADPMAGEQVYAAQCASCHGANGQGLKSGDRVLFPPLWGLGSFAHGAGMSRAALAARFIWANMPLDKPYSMTPQQAKDVAAYMDLQFRAPDPRKGLLGWVGK
jgi:thiosulfate dehydrogenase